MKNILITGANGMLGTSLCIYFSNIASYRVFPTSRVLNIHCGAENFLIGDLTQQSFIDSLNRFQFDVIIHCAALTDIERCEKEPAEAFLINASATENLVKMFPEATFFYISTDSVFDGKTGNYDESDAPNPLNVYAKTKLAGEKFVAAENEKHYILRTNMYGFHRPPSGRSLFEWSYQNLSNGNEVRGFSNVVFNPLYVGQLAEVIENLISQKIPFGTYNAVCHDSLSKFEFLHKISEIFGLSANLILPFEISDKPVNALRPLRTFLKNDKLVKALPNLDLSIDRGFHILYDDFSKFGK